MESRTPLPRYPLLRQEVRAARRAPPVVLLPVCVALLQTCESSPPPTDVLSGPPIFQDGNARPTTAIVPKRFRQLADNRLGDMFPLDRPASPCPRAEDDWSVTHVGALSLKWVRLSVDVLEWETARNARAFSQWPLNPCQDEIVSALVANDITILHTIVHWDAMLHAARPPDYRNTHEVQLYLDYARLIARHFKGRVRYYEILNEAVTYVALADYVELVRRAIPVIREEDPDAKIVVGGSSNLLYPDNRDYLVGVLASDIVALVDGIALHPMYGASPQYEDTRQYYYDYPALVQELRNIASAHGFVGEFIAEEMDWRTPLNPNSAQPWQYTTLQAAKYYARGIVMNLGMDLRTGVGGEMYDEIPPIPTIVRNLGTVLGAATPQAQSVEIRGGGGATFMNFGFALPNATRLVAVWTNGIAVNEDPGVPVTLVLQNLAGRRVIGVDPLRGLEQELTAEAEDGALLVRNFLVRDYPVFLRILPS